MKYIAFIRQLLVVLLQHGLDPNVHFSSRTEHILLSLLEMVLRARSPPDLDYVYDLSLTLIQFGANPNVNITSNGEFISLPVPPEYPTIQIVLA